MPKSNGVGRVSAGRGSSAIVDVVQRRQADRLAKIAFMVTWPTVGLIVAVVAAAITDWWLAVAIGAGAGFAVAFVVAVVVFIWPALRLLWYWAAEISALVLLLGTFWALTLVVPWWAAIALVTVAVATPFGFRTSRTWLVAWCWCAISRHRLRTCFATFIRANRYGSLPLMLWARPTPAGERVWVWLRPGLSLDDLTTEGGLARLAVGSWASEVRITRASRRQAALVRVDITHRRPLSDLVTSPLVGLVPDLAPETVDLDQSSEVGGLDLADVPDPGTTTTTAGVVRPRTASNGAARSRNGSSRPAAPAAAKPGDDLSEWV